jgi:adenosylcobyric acid synthase
MRMAELADAVCLLVGDIDRGGVFASLLGTVQLLDPHEQERIQGFLINKFRGDLSLLEPGLRMIEERLAKPCLGVIPFLTQLALDEEDSLGLPAVAFGSQSPWPASGCSADPNSPLRIAVISLPSFSNFTDFDALRAEPSISLHLCRNREQLQQSDIIILPGSKQTAGDLLWMRSEGLDRALLDHARTGLVVGICGGMQILGKEILDPHVMEHGGVIPGLGLLAIQTTMQPRKVTRISSGHLFDPLLFGYPTPRLRLNGYEIHVGETHYLESAKPFARLHTALAEDSHLDGCVAPDGRIFGSYLHGLFDDDIFRHAFVAAARGFCQLAPATHLDHWKKKREASLDRLADTVRRSVDMPRIFAWAGLTYQPRNAKEQRH